MERLYFLRLNSNDYKLSKRGVILTYRDLIFILFFSFLNAQKFITFADISLRLFSRPFSVESAVR